VRQLRAGDERGARARSAHARLAIAAAGLHRYAAFGGFENRRAGWTIRVEELDPSEYPRLAAAFSSAERANELFGPDGVRIMTIE
jgi:hypothetical protein